MHTNINEMNRAMERIVYREDGRALAGLATIVMRGGETAYENAVGTQDFARSLPLQLDSRARIASVSKTFVAIAAMQLKDAGKLDLDADAGEYLGFALRNPRYPQTPITTRMLLSHTSSLRDNDDYWLPIGANTSDFFRDARYYAAEAPGYYCYCNLNFGLLGTIIEKLSGEKFNQYMNRHVFVPMGIKASFDVCDFNAQEIDKLAPIYNGGGKGGWEAALDDYRGRVVPRNPAREAVAPGVNGTLYSPQGGLRISVRELTALIRTFLRGGDGILSPESVAEMFTPVWTYDGSNGFTDGGFDRSYGLGVHILTNSGGDSLVKDRSLPYAGHTGNAYGLFSGWYLDRESGNAVLYMCNGTQCGVETPLSRGTFSQNWIWVEELMEAIHTYILPA